MKRPNVVFAAVLILALIRANEAPCQVPKPAQKDPFEQTFGGLTLEGQTVGDAIADLSQTTNVAYSIEFPLGTNFADPAPPLKSIVARIGAGTIHEILDQLCQLDPTFTWSRTGNVANIFPSALRDNPSYLLNRRVPLLTFRGVPDAQKAVFEAVHQLPLPKEQIAMLEGGTSVGFAKPWTATFTDITMRQAFDLIAQNLGPTYGWQFGGGNDFRVITFHVRMSPRSRAVTR